MLLRPQPFDLRQWHFALEKLACGPDAAAAEPAKTGMPIILPSRPHYTTHSVQDESAAHRKTTSDTQEARGHPKLSLGLQQKL